MTNSIEFDAQQLLNEYMSEEVVKENDKSTVIAKAPVVENKQ